MTRTVGPLPPPARRRAAICDVSAKLPIQRRGENLRNSLRCTAARTKVDSRISTAPQWRKKRQLPPVAREKRGLSPIQRAYGDDPAHPLHCPLSTIRSACP